MPKIKYKEENFRPESLAKIKQANAIIAEYDAAGYELTLRQLYYQFVARDLIPNTQKSYDNLGELLNKARWAGLVDWLSITDRTRNLSTHASWTSPRAIVEACASQFQYDPWLDQRTYVEVWVEKEALAGIIERACEKYRVSHFSCRGYTSASEIWSAAQRLAGYTRGEKRGVRIKGGKRDVTVIHLGDHDPSGIDMTRDIEERLQILGGTSRIKVKRIALNMDQVEEYNPPPNPAKVTDSRFENYRAEFGEESWELDALEPATIHEMIESEIASHIDQDAWQAVLDREETAKGEIEAVSDQLSDD